VKEEKLGGVVGEEGECGDDVLGLLERERRRLDILSVKKEAKRGWSVCMYVCLCVGHVHEPCETGWTYRDVIWKTNPCGPKSQWLWHTSELCKQKPTDRHAVCGLTGMAWGSMYEMGIKVRRIHSPPQWWRNGDAAFCQNILTTCSKLCWRFAAGFVQLLVKTCQLLKRETNCLTNWLTLLA